MDRGQNRYIWPQKSDQAWCFLSDRNGYTKYSTWYIRRLIYIKTLLKASSYNPNRKTDGTVRGPRRETN